MNIFEVAEKVLSNGYVCNHCLGRQFAQLLSGFTDDTRGEIIRTALAMNLDKNEMKVDLTNFEEFHFRTRKLQKSDSKKACPVCENIFDKIHEIVKNVKKETKNVEFGTFHVGIKLSKELLEKEESLWEKSGIDFCESIKSELSREVGKVVSRKLKKEVDFARPDLVIMLNLEDNKIELLINSMFVRGKYKKFVKIPQARHFCMKCNAVGCKLCNFTGKRFQESVQEWIAEEFLKETKGKDTKFHGAGREDIDVLCLDGRDFVLEILDPSKRKIDLKKMEKKVNKYAKGKVSVYDLTIAKKDDVIDVKSSRKNKIYKAVVNVDKNVSKKDIEKLQKLVGTIQQRTPQRVEHRRADLVRKRSLFSIKGKIISKKKMELEIKGEAGLYIKELVSGDEGRTKPSVSQILGKKTEVEKLDVIGFE